MTEGEMRDLEQEVLEVMSNEPMRLMEIYKKGFICPFSEVFQAIANLLRDGYVSYHEIEGKPAYSRTFKGYERQAMFYE